MAWKKREPKPFYKRFWEKIDVRGPDECWPWLGCKNNRSYGLIRVPDHSSPQLATRVMMVMKTGRLIPDGLVVMHSCDNPPCVNPAHLSLGTLSDNSQDMVRKGRCSYGFGNNCKLSPEIVRRIICLLAAGELTHEEIARRYGVGRSTVTDINIGRTWPTLTTS